MLVIGLICMGMQAIKKHPETSKKHPGFCMSPECCRSKRNRGAGSTGMQCHKLWTQPSWAPSCPCHSARPVVLANYAVCRLLHPQEGG